MHCATDDDNSHKRLLKVSITSSGRQAVRGSVPANQQSIATVSSNDRQGGVTYQSEGEFHLVGGAPATVRPADLYLVNGSASNESLLLSESEGPQYGEIPTTTKQQANVNSTRPYTRIILNSSTTRQQVPNFAGQASRPVLYPANGAKSSSSQSLSGSTNTSRPFNPNASFHMQTLSKGNSVQEQMTQSLSQAYCGLGPMEVPNNNETTNTGGMNEFLDAFIDKMMTAPLGKPIRKQRGALMQLIKGKEQLSPLVRVHVKPQEIRVITRLAVEKFKSEPPMLNIEVTRPVHFFGDLHGQFRDVRMMINQIGMPPENHYLFLGDYVDRGLQGVESFLLILALRCRYPEAVHMLRGNHEDVNTAQTYGFYDEVMIKYGDVGEQVWLHLLSCFNWMPVCALLNKKIIAMHGGISPHIVQSLAHLDQIKRPTTIPPYGLMCDLVWSDPDTYGKWALSARGISFSFDESAVEEFCTAHGIELIVRAHQISSEMVRHGHRWFAGGRLVTVFSAPNYMNMGNDACVFKVEPNMACQVLCFRASTSIKKKGTLRKKASEILKKVEKSIRA